MEKYESLGMVGEGSYGMVLKCRHRESGQLVAIKKFIESEDDKMVKKIAMREIRMLKQLRHDNLVNLIEVFRRKKRLYLVFEFMDHTVLDDLDRSPGGLEEDKVRRILFQVLRGIEFCHLHNIIHRDIKPENILVSKSGVVKMCDFGFARTLAKPGEVYTDYVATRWYRAPELLVGDTNYGRAVDIWAIGCLFGELLTAEPLFPGESDIDQLFHIIKCFGYLTARHQEIFHKNPLFERLRLPVVSEVEPLEKRYARLSPVAVDFMTRCLQLDADDRPTCSQLLKHDFFTSNQFAQKFNRELQGIIQREHRNNPLLKKGRTPDRELAPKAGVQTNHGYGTDGEQNDKQENDKISHDLSDKPKRKLPDVEKVSRTSPPINNLSNGTASPRASVTQHLQAQESNPLSESLSGAMTHSLQGIGTVQERMLEKAKAHSKKGNHVPGKKANNLTNHYRSMVTSQMTTTGSQFSTNERPVIATKLKPGPKRQMAPVDKREGRFHLPNVRSNEAASPSRVAYKTSSSSQMTCMPQIGNVDSFTETS